MPETSVQASRNQNAESACDLILTVARALVDDRDSVKIELQQDLDATTLILWVAPSDLGTLAGNEGRIARSIRTILSATGMKQQRRYCLDIRSMGSL